MAIADSTLLLEGQRDFSGGMNSSLVPALIPENSVYRSVNVSFRGGTPATRPGLRQLNLNNGTNSGIDIFVNEFMQGASFYKETRTNRNSSLFCVMSGYVVKIDLGTYVVDRLYPLDASGTPDTTKRLNPTASKVYFCQAEKYLIIQDGSSIPYIWDGDYLYESGIGPAGSTGAVSQIHTIGSIYGSVMAYGQGRLYIASEDRTRFYAGDLAYGGSTNQVAISSGTATSATSAVYTFTTASAHGFIPGDVISIYGHSSSNGANGTWTCATGTTGSTIVINLANATSTTATGTGGYAAKANSGAVSDILRFSETTYLDEGGALEVPSFLGRVTGMIFMPVQDTGTGQGDLLVFSEQGVASFAVSVPRTQWKETSGFQRVAFSTIGATSHESLVTSNGDVFFRAFDGLRTYRNARAELNSFGQVPISAELNSLLPYDTLSMLETCSSIVFDNRLLFTASPKIDYTGVPTSREVVRPVTFSTIAVLDFTTLSSVGAKRTASYDGLWKGFDVTRLVSGLVKDKPRAFAFCVDYINDATNTLWEFTTDSPYDEPLNSDPVRIQSILETRTFALGSPAEVKKLIRADLWIAGLRGSTDFNVYWRPDEYPCWRTWHSFVRCAQVENCIVPGVATEFNSAAGTVTIGFTSSAIRWYRISVSGFYTEPLQFADGPDDSATVSAALAAAGIVHTTVTRSGTFPNFAYVVSGVSSDFLVIPVQDPGTALCSSTFAPKNLQPQYRPQIRMPTPPEDSDPIVGRPYYFGNDFQLRIEWTGHCRLTRILVLGQRQLEQYQGTDYVEVV